MIVYGVLIKHATAGLILFETGCHDEMEKHWGPVSELAHLHPFHSMSLNEALATDV